MADRKRPLRCAIYTRKSSEEGLEQDFNSLDAQREACEAYVASQKSEGWTLLQNRFDDGGFSGGTLDRPALQQLLADIEGGRIDVIVVYKIDRLSRSLMDFARLVEVMDRKNVTFVSVTQSFNTTTSMGRLTLNILLSFAQFEREVTGERIRDKIAASKKKGMWMGGHVPIGYDADDRSLSINEAEAETVRAIFAFYLETGNVRTLQTEAARRGLTTKRRVSARGTAFGGRPFSRGHIYKILSNPLYVGEIEHKGLRHPGQHPAIIDRGIFDAVQARLRENTRGRRGRANAKESSLLSGLIFDETGNRFTATHAVKNGRRYRYYVAMAREAGPEAGGGSPAIRLSASAIEPVVVRQIVNFLGQASRLIDELGLRQLAPDAQTDVMARLKRLGTDMENGQSAEQREILIALAEQISVGTESLRIRLNRGWLGVRLLGDSAPPTDHDDPIVIEAPIRIARRGAETRLVIEGESAPAHRSPNPALVRSVARGHAWFDDLTSGRARSIREIAAREGLADRYVARLLDLAFLPPATVEDILDGRQSVEWTSGMLSRSEHGMLWSGV